MATVSRKKKSLAEKEDVDGGYMCVVSIKNDIVQETACYPVCSTQKSKLQHSKFFYKHRESKPQPTLCLNCYCNWDSDACGRDGSNIHHVVTARAEI